MSATYHSTGTLGIYQCVNNLETKTERAKFRFKPHQSRIIQYCLEIPDNSNQRGILLYHTLGLGKTCTSIGIADELLKSGKYDHVIILLPATLRVNFVKEYCGKCGKSHINRFDKLFSFYAYNDSGIIDRFPESIDRCIIIIDEVHNLLAGCVNQSKNKTYLHQVIKQSTNSFIIALSGTPIYGSTFELFYLQELLQRQHKLPNNIEEWREFVEKSPDLLVNSIRNTISYIEPNDLEQYPRLVGDYYILVPLTDQQIPGYNRWLEIEDKLIQKMIRRLSKTKTNLKMHEIIAEIELETDYKKETSGLEYLALTHFFTRRLSLVAYPAKKTELIDLPQYIRNDFANLNDFVDLVYQLDMWNQISKYSYNQLEQNLRIRKNQDKLAFLKIKKKPLILGLTRNVFDQDPLPVLTDLELTKLTEFELNQQNTIPAIQMLQIDQVQNIYSPKFYILYQNIIKSEGKHVIYCPFKTHYGVYLISAFLTMHGISTLVYTGDQNERDKDIILSQFNHSDNLNGELYRVLILSDAGTEGLTILATQYIHIMSPQYIQNRLKQVIGRIRRLNSHIELSPDKRTVTVYRYISVFNPKLFDIIIPTIDPLSPNFYQETKFFRLGIKDETENETDSITLDDVSIDQKVVDMALVREREINTVLNLMCQASVEFQLVKSDNPSTEQ